MAKPSVTPTTKKKKNDSEHPKKRQLSDINNESSFDDDEDLDSINIANLLDLSASESGSEGDDDRHEDDLDNSESEDEIDNESDNDDNKDTFKGFSSEEDSDAEFNKILAEDDENDSYSESSIEDDEEPDPRQVKLKNLYSNSKSKLSNNNINNNNNTTIVDNSDYTLDVESDDDGLLPGEKLVTAADGRPRILKPEINPDYASDDSDAPIGENTLGNIPLSAYDSYPHIGYDINGKRIMRPATGSALDSLLEQIELPEGWTGLLDKESGKGLKLTHDELNLVRKIQQGINPDDSIDPYEDTVEWFTHEQETAPLSAAPEPKRRFIPSKHEAKRIMKIVKAIREGRIVPNKSKKDTDSDDDIDSESKSAYDIWSDNLDPQLEHHIMHISAPKLPPPTHEESYNPPEEYLLSEEEKKKWLETDEDDRERNFLPQKFSALRHVPGYENFVRERFERSLDLYLAPRVRKNKLNIDPDSLIPKLPSPKDLRPFPTRCATVYYGHSGKVRSLSIDPLGLWLATGGDDGTVRIFEIISGKQVYLLHTEIAVGLAAKNTKSPVETVEWNPNKGVPILACGVAENIILITPHSLFSPEEEKDAQKRVSDGWGYATDKNKSSNSVNENKLASWDAPTTKAANAGVLVIIHTNKVAKKINWHRRGDYFISVSPQGGNSSSVLIHQLSKHLTQTPFRKSHGLVQEAKFHPFKPVLFVATQRYIRIYDLHTQALIRKLLPGVRWLSSFDIHPTTGEHVLTGSYDKRVTWHDLDLAPTPYKTLRYHSKAVRDVSFHKTLPLFCSASDDGAINIFHGTVYDDLMKNPLLVPLKVLKGHSIVSSLGVLQVVWHPREPWLFSAGADGTARLWTT